jgi:peptide deformylase
MYAAPGRGLAAPQVGVMQRLFVMDTGWKDGASDPRVFLDPRIVAVSAATETRAEGCLSIPGILVEVTRPAQVKIAFRDATGQARTEDFTGFAAACIQHEIDHLEGRVTFDYLDAAARATAEAAYAEARP